MTSKTVGISRKATNSNEKALIFNTCWSTDDVRKPQKCTQYKESQWKISHFNKFFIVYKMDEKASGM